MPVLKNQYRSNSKPSVTRWTKRFTKQIWPLKSLFWTHVCDPQSTERISVLVITQARQIHGKIISKSALHIALISSLLYVNCKAVVLCTSAQERRRTSDDRNFFPTQKVLSFRPLSNSCDGQQTLDIHSLHYA
jgi:hypothetical protein